MVGASGSLKDCMKQFIPRVRGSLTARNSVMRHTTNRMTDHGLPQLVQKKHLAKSQAIKARVKPHRSRCPQH